MQIGSWRDDYPDNRKQPVIEDNVTSQILNLTCGVSQGSRLGPLLVCNFINELPDVLAFSDPRSYAHDLKIVILDYI